MNRSQYSQLLKLAKGCLAEYLAFGEEEIILPATAVKTVKAAAPGGKLPTLEEYKKQISGCRKCPLGKSRLNFVFGVGNPKARLMFVGEGPGFDEDHKGEPFVGRAGQLLTKIIESIGLKREDVFIANVVKCHPMIDPSDPEKRANDRPPTPEEAAECIGYLEKQIDIIKPEFICALGSSAAKALLATEITISKLRGRYYDYRGAKLLPTFHPAALLRNPVYKKDVWEDMKMLKRSMGI
ncbi:MAG TPA: uracil-DNA glycosylase [Elusimicrobia bacterium]|nr:MAG: hypothetical protein A2278_01050 [Elusimicrobia bacterium RIFOXYA12_FULL_49_49]OGS11206.1 MAG: hypothetical protein A2386_04575 [Elusimicrobia bacterium RIFOXYB1_FULL_48_9]OGS15784.1 MAG: hypothetical protein A2251_03950 [Elusimicrobia bacterium RIFOXYA2_FULL_47_53]OGS25973.1 MAG: hypothetical protein A2339_05345 [Elusimicrobia bacterium RIFOXYB12_FULL_50_12]OGS31117.1 MAG: hypothetical protein A2323_08675 [Elusimicrobia bacterium RIFOXYB2_FULL_46_23]HBU69474.1 uracil-DNA glycosylase [